MIMISITCHDGIMGIIELTSQIATRTADTAVQRRDLDRDCVLVSWAPGIWTILAL